MSNFIDLMGNVTYTEAQIGKRLTSLERQTYSLRNEAILGRLGVGFALGKRSPKTEEATAIDAFTTFMTGLEAEGVLIRADNELLKSTLSYEASTLRLAKYILVDGVAEVPYEEATYDEDTGEELTPEVPYVAPIAPLDEFITVPTYDEDGNQTGTEDIRNPLVVTDEEERASAQNTIDNTSQDVVDLVALREEA